MPGRLYGLRRYPGMREPREPGEWVFGEVYRIPEPRRVLAKLDAYEGANYRRVRRLAILADGVELDCWVYLYVNALPEHRRLASGAWAPRQ